MSIRGYVKRTKPAAWTTVAGAKPIRAFVAVRRPKRDRKPLQRGSKRVAARSKRKCAQDAVYGPLARQMVKEAQERGELCPVVQAIHKLTTGMKYGHLISAKLNEVHHIFGRQGKLLTWVPGLMPLSKQGHRWVHSNREKAKELGWLAPDGIWNDYERAVTYVASMGQRTAERMKTEDTNKDAGNDAVRLLVSCGKRNETADCPQQPQNPKQDNKNHVAKVNHNGTEGNTD